MIFIFSLLYLIIAILAFFFFKSFIFNPVTIMFGIWALLLPLSSIGFYDVSSISNKTNAIIFIGLLGYLLGNLVSKPIKVTVGNRSLINPSNKYVLNYPFLYFLYIVSTVYLVVIAIVAIRLLIQGYNLDYIRGLTTAEGTNELRSSMFSILMKNFIATPTVYLAIAIMPIELVMGKKKKSLIALTLIMIFCWVISVGGRSILLWTIIYFVAVIVFAGKGSFQFNVSKRVKRIATVTIILLFVFLIWSTVSRKGNDFDLFRQLFIYYVAPLKHFDLYVELIDNSYHDFISYGAASFYGFIYLILYAVRFFTGSDGYSDFWVTVRDLSFEKLEHTTWLGGDVEMNAFVTIFYQPYIDGRFIGVFIILFLFGMCCNMTFRIAHDYKNMKYILIYLLFLQKIIDSMVRFYFTQTSQAMCLIFALFALVPLVDNNYLSNNKRYN